VTAAVNKFESFRALLRHVSFNYREGGLAQIAYKILWRLGRFIYSDVALLIYSQELRDFSLPPRLPLTESTLDFGALVHLRYYKAIAFPEAIKERIASGCVCHGFFLDGRLVHVGWTSPGYLEPEPGTRIRDHDCSGIHDCFTVPEYRARGIYTDCLIRLLVHARDRGFLRALIAVDPDNLASIRAIEKVGFQRLYRLTISRRLGWRYQRKATFQLAL